MKVETKEPEFKPIVITLETKEEAIIMWHLMNNSEDVSFSDYKVGVNIPRGTTKFTTEMWEQLDKQLDGHIWG
jgi:hypothetical protein